MRRVTNVSRTDRWADVGHMVPSQSIENFLSGIAGRMYEAKTEGCLFAETESELFLLITGSYSVRLTPALANGHSTQTITPGSPLPTLVFAAQCC